ncbi:unnamed protein product [Rhizophagus irregularis]|nr:unnamed protein product [Rhizophagus irregularis]
MERQKNFSPSRSKRNNDNLIKPFSSPISALDYEWHNRVNKLQDLRYLCILHFTYGKWKRLLSAEAAFNEFDSTFTPSHAFLDAYASLCSIRSVTFDRLLSILSRKEKTALRRTLVKRSTSCGLSDHSSNNPESSRNFVPKKFTPSAVAPAFTPNDYQDGSLDMASDPVLQSVIRDPAFQRICPTGPDQYTYGSDGEINDFLLPDCPPDLSSTVNNVSSPWVTPPHFEDDDGLSFYVPSESASVSQLMSDTGSSYAHAAPFAARLPALYAHAKAKYATPIVTPPQQVESFIDFDELLSVYDIPLLPRSFDTFTLIDDSDDEPYDSDDDSQFSLSSFDDSSPLGPLSNPIVPLQIAFPLFCFDPCPLVVVSSTLFSDSFSDNKPFSIGPYFNFSKFERRRKWKIYCSSLTPVVIFISWIFLTCSLWFRSHLRIMDGLLKSTFSCSINRFINLFSFWSG